MRCRRFRIAGAFAFDVFTFTALSHCERFRNAANRFRNAVPAFSQCGADAFTLRRFRSLALLSSLSKAKFIVATNCSFNFFS